MPPRAIKKFVRRIFNDFGFEIGRLPRGFDRNLERVVSLRASGIVRGTVLLSYLNEPFLISDGAPLPNSHTNYWECREIAKTFLELGYHVDVINSYNIHFLPQKRYDVFIGHRNQYERIAGLLGRECLKIAHFDTAHWLFNNLATYKRSYDLQQRRRVTVSRWSQRIIEHNEAIECADCATVLGNEFTIGTFRFADKPIFRIPISTCDIYPWPATKDFDVCRRNYLWFGSSAMVHKGLDLVLEAFCDLPEHHLTICGPVAKEPWFEKAFHKELYKSKNVQTVGWVDTGSADFADILNNCIGVIYPSCSEGGGGSVITCMHGGLIPIASYESSVDIEDEFGVVLRDCSVESIKGAIRYVSDLSPDRLETMSRRSWEFARRNHTRENFSIEYRKVVTEILRTFHEKVHLTPE